MAYEYIFFDMDGVVIDSETAKFSFLQTVARKHNVVIEPDKFTLSKGKTAKGFIEDIGIAEDAKTLILTEFMETYLPNVTRYAEPIESTVAFIKSLSDLNVRIVIVSNGFESVNRRICDDFGISSYVDSIFSRESVDKMKPDPAIYLAAMRHYSAEASECVAIEDSIPGITAAVAAGIDCFAFVNGYEDESMFNNVKVKGLIKSVHDYSNLRHWLLQ